MVGKGGKKGKVRGGWRKYEEWKQERGYFPRETQPTRALKCHRYITTHASAWFCDLTFAWEFENVTLWLNFAHICCVKGWRYEEASRWILHCHCTLVILHFWRLVRCARYQRYWRLQWGNVLFRIKSTQNIPRYHTPYRFTLSLYKLILRQPTLV